MMGSSDARELQPKAKTIDLSAQGSGMPFYAVIKTEAYHGVDLAKVYPELLTVRFRARDFSHAVEFAKAMATIIQLGHDVHRALVKEVGEPKFDHITRPAERPVVGA